MLNYQAELINIDEKNKIIIFERANFLIWLNFHPTKSQLDYPIKISTNKAYELILNTDNPDFGGHNILKKIKPYEPINRNKIQIYLPARTGIVLKLSSN